jgi:ribosomal protein S18 acetylase RimI-like enzyme
MESAYDIPEIDGLYMAQRADLMRFTECTGEAYRGYPLFEYLFKGRYNARTVNIVFATELKSLGDRQVSFATDESADAVATFIPPVFYGTSASSYILSGGLRLLLHMGPASLKRLDDFEKYSMGLKRKYADEDSWYLLNLAVRPEAQGNGLASKLMKPMMEYFDRTGQKCYLETLDSLNVPIYEHFGFKVVEVGKLLDSDMPQYAMLREPMARGRTSVL